MKPLAWIVACVLVAATGSQAAAQSSGLLRVAVLPVRSEAYVWGWQPEAAVTPMLEAIVLTSGRAALVERRRLDTVLEEQILRRTGLVDAEAAARIGGVLGVDLLILGHITEASLAPAGRLWTPSGEIVTWRSAVTLSVRVVAVRDGRVMLVRMTRGAARGMDFRATAGGVTLGAQIQPPNLMSVAAQAAVDELRLDLSRVLATVTIDGE